MKSRLTGLLLLVQIALLQALLAVPGVDPLLIPDSDEGVPGAGPLRRTDWFRGVWRSRRGSWLDKTEAQTGSVVFLGDSITEGWGDDFKGAFGKLKVANRGIRGDTSRGLLLRLKEDVIDLEPRAVVVMIGANDLAEKAKGETVFGNVKLIVEALKSHNPKMPIVVCETFPCAPDDYRPVAEIRKINALYEDAYAGDPQVTLAKTYGLFSGGDGASLPEFLPDRVHPNAAGYARWAGAMRPIFAKLGFTEATTPEPNAVSTSAATTGRSRSLKTSTSLLADDWKPEEDPRFIPPGMFEIDPSLELTVWASTPHLYNPTNMDIDHAGRIWVAEGVNYRGRNGTRPAGDRIAVLQDTDGDGRCDSSHTFVQETGLIAPLGVAVFDNVVYVSQPPDLIAYTDVDRDLKFDPEVDRREVVLTGFNAINHDHGLHSIIAGPDGKFYFNNGNCGAVFTDKTGRTFYMGGTYGGSGPNWPADHMSNSGKRSDDGHVWTSGFAVRMDPDGSNCEIVTSNPEKQFDGADFSGKKPVDKDSDEIAPTYFRPSDVTVGPDGAIYFCDWFDPRIGASAHMDETFSGTIYRIAPRDFKPLIPELNLSTTGGQIAALRSPAINTRHLGFRALKAQGAAAFSAVAALLTDENRWIAARAVWLLPHLGDEGVKACVERLEDDRAEQRLLAYRSLRRAGHDIVQHARRLAADPSPRVRCEIALSLRDIPAEKTADIFVELARRCVTEDKNSVEAIGLGAANQEGMIWLAIRAGLEPGKPAEWPDSFARLTWRLWGADSIDDLKARALDKSLPLEKRKFAVESIGFIDAARAAEAMLELASDGSPVKGEATAWLLRNLTGEWAKHGIGKGLKEKGIYDPEAIKVSASPVPIPPANAKLLPVADILKLKGEAKRGKIAAARCAICHQIDGKGIDYGPGLKGWGATQNLEAIVRAIAEPSAEIALGFAGIEVQLKDGGVIHGIAFNNSDLWLERALPLVIQSAGGITQLIPKDRIEKTRDFKRSLMYEPTTLGLTEQDIADIAAWLRTYR